MIAIGTAPVTARSTGGSSDSARTGLDAAKSRRNLSAFSWPRSFGRLATYWVVVVCWVGSGSDHFALEMRPDPIFERLWRISGPNNILIVNNTDQPRAVIRPQIRSINVFG